MQDPTISYPSAEDFLRRLDRGELNGNLTVELQKLTKEQLERVAAVLLEREEAKKVRGSN